MKRGYRISNELVRHSVLASVVPTTDDLLDVQGSLLLAANASLDSAAWFLHPERFTRLRKIRVGSGTGSYMLMQSDAGILRPAVAAGRRPLRHQGAERRRHLQPHHRLMAEHKGAKAPEKTAEGLRPAVAGDQPGRPLVALPQRVQPVGDRAASATG